MMHDMAINKNLTVHEVLRDTGVKVVTFHITGPVSESDIVYSAYAQVNERAGIVGGHNVGGFGSTMGYAVDYNDGAPDLVSVTIILN